MVDIGGQTYHEQVQYVFDMFGSDHTSKVLFINCFGGMQDTLKISALLCHAISLGITNKKPVIVRMKGLSSKEANEKLREFNK